MVDAMVWVKGTTDNIAYVGFRVVELPVLKVGTFELEGGADDDVMSPYRSSRQIKFEWK